jgi:mevalonate kinase
VTFSRTTLRGAPVVAAPGKVFLVGEYAVLDEGVAILAAVSRYAVAQYVPNARPEGPLIDEAIRRGVAALGELAVALPPGAPLVDSAQFEDRGRKLGLGSSAAAAVAAVGAVFENAGLPISSHLDLVHSVADAAHRAAQAGVGSGADVAAAAHGGFIQFLRPRDGFPAVVTRTPPTALQISVFWTGAPSPTVDMIAAVRAFADRAPPLYAWQMDQLRAIADRFAKDFSSNHARGVVAAAEEYGRALRDLGSSAGVSIVTPAFEAAAALARTLGGAAKPSGAGGGDVGVAFFTDRGAASEFAARCPEGVSMLDLRLGAAGVHKRLPGSIESFKTY